MAALTLVPTDRSYADAIQRLASDPEIAATTLIPHPYPEDGAIRFIEDLVLPARAAGTHYAFVMMVDGEFVGHISVKDVDRARGEGETGYWVGRPFWGHGYASEALRLIVAFGFGELELEHIYAHVLAGNPASARVLEKVGFARVEHPDEALPDACLAKGETLRYELLRPAK